MNSTADLPASYPSRIKSGGLIVISIALLVTSWLALDDITTGTESNTWLEWLWVSTTLIWFLILGVRRVGRRETQD